jgi:hypothetical protein
LRLALAGGQAGSTKGCWAIRAQRFIFWAMRISLTSRRACIFSISSRNWLRVPVPTPIQSSARRDSGLIFPAMMRLSSVEQNRPACWNCQGLRPSNGFESRPTVTEWHRKVLGRSLDRPHFSHSGVGKSEEQSSGEQSSSSDGRLRVPFAALGHSSLEMTRKYVGLTTGDLVAAHRSLLCCR